MSEPDKNEKETGWTLPQWRLACLLSSAVAALIVMYAFAEQWRPKFCSNGEGSGACVREWLAMFAPWVAIAGVIWATRRTVGPVVAQWREMRRQTLVGLRLPLMERAALLDRITPGMMDAERALERCNPSHSKQSQQKTLSPQEILLSRSVSSYLEDAASSMRGQNLGSLFDKKILDEIVGIKNKIHGLSARSRKEEVSYSKYIEPIIEDIRLIRSNIVRESMYLHSEIARIDVEIGLRGSASLNALASPAAPSPDPEDPRAS